MNAQVLKHVLQKRAQMHLFDEDLIAPELDRQAADLASDAKVRAGDAAVKAKKAKGPGIFAAPKHTPWRAAKRHWRKTLKPHIKKHPWRTAIAAGLTASVPAVIMGRDAFKEEGGAAVGALGDAYDAAKAKAKDMSEVVKPPKPDPKDKPTEIPWGEVGKWGGGALAVGGAALLLNHLMSRNRDEDE